MTTEVIPAVPEEPLRKAAPAEPPAPAAPEPEKGAPSKEQLEKVTPKDAPTVGCHHHRLL